MADASAHRDRDTPTPGWYGAVFEEGMQAEDPYPGYRELRETQPVNLTPDGTWRLSRYDDIQRLLREVPSGVRLTDGRIPGQAEQVPGARKAVIADVAHMVNMEAPGEFDRLVLEFLETVARAQPQERAIGDIETVAEFHGPMPTGVTVSRGGRVFVNFPRWGDDVPATVVEIVDVGAQIQAPVDPRTHAARPQAGPGDDALRCGPVGAEEARITHRSAAARSWRSALSNDSKSAAGGTEISSGSPLSGCASLRRVAHSAWRRKPRSASPSSAVAPAGTASRPP